MKNGIIIGLLVFLLAAVGFLFYKEFTTTQKKLAYIKSVEVVNEFTDMKEARVAFEKEAKTWQSQVDTLTAEVQQAIKDYERKSGSMNDSEKEMARSLIKTKQDQLVNFQKAIQEKASKRDAEMTMKVINKLNAFLEEYGKEHDYDIIFGVNESGNIIYGKDYLDITDDVIKEMNE